MLRIVGLLAASAALVGCIPDVGSPETPDAAPDGGDSDVGVPDSAPPGDSATDAAPLTEDMFVMGQNMEFWFTVDGGPTGPDPNTMYVKAGTLVHFSLQSSPNEEQHEFEITIPGDQTQTVKMAFAPDENHLDWTAPSTPGTYAGAVVCPVHLPGMKSDAVIQ